MNNISLISLLRLAVRYIYLLIVVALVAAILAFSYCKFIAVPKYSATGSLLVTNGAIITEDTSKTEISSNKVNQSDIVASLQLSNTIVDILKTNDIYKKLSDNINNKYTYQNLIGRTSIQRRDTNTLFIDISFTASTPKEAQTLVNEYLTLVPNYIVEFIPGTKTAITFADSAAKTYPNTLSTVMLSAILCAVLTYTIVFIISFFNTTIKNEDDIKNNYELMVIGNIPDFATANSKGYYKYNSYVKGGGDLNGK